METSGSVPEPRREAARSVFSRLDEPRTPLTTTEVADRLECSDDDARRALEALADRGEVRSRRVDERRVWWRPETAGAGSNGRSELAELGAFVRAVKDYAIFTLDPDGVIASWNEGARRIKGYTEDEIVGKHFSTFYTEEDVDAGVAARNLEAARTDGRVEDEGWRVREDGSQFWADVVITASRNADGELLGFTKVTRDMTEQREYEQQLRRESKQTEKLIRTAPVAIAVQNAAGETVLANQRTQEALGVSEKELIEASEGDGEWNLYDASGEPIAPDETPAARVRETGTPVLNDELIAESPEGDRTHFRVNAAPVFGADGDIERVITAGEDITELKRRERQLERRRSELETELSEIFGRISDAFYALDDDWRFTHLNDRAAELFQMPADELRGRSIWEAVPEQTDGKIREQFHTAVETQETATFELNTDDPDVWLEFNAYPSESGLSVYFRDITERKEYERKLKESNERLEQFAYAASHDLQEPLRMVSSYLRLIERRYADAFDEDGREFLAFAVDGADRMRHMIDGLLTYSRVDTRGDPFEPVDLDGVLAEVLTDLRLRIEESDADVTADPLPRVRGDPSQVRQVFQNLLDNAIEYSGDDPPDVHVSAERDGDEWVISVRDEGIGFDPDDADRVFDVFESLHPPDEHSGTGIGLAICERIVERHGGDVWVDAAPGTGATFSFTLPAMDGHDE